MLNRNYDMRYADDVRELYRAAPQILLAIFAAINEHNNIVSAIGYKIKHNNEFGDSSVQETLGHKKSVRAKILTACRSIGYTYAASFEGRIHSLTPRRDSKRLLGSIYHLNAKALFIFSDKEAVSKLESLLVSNIIEGTND